VALILALVIKLLAGFLPGVVENGYSRGVFPFIAWTQSFINRWFPFSLAELLIVVSIAGVLVYLARSLILIARGRRQWKTWLRVTAYWALSFAAWGLLLFLLAWGLNYDRRPIAVNLNLPQREPVKEELLGIGRRIVDGINRNYSDSGAPVGPDGGTHLPFDRATLNAVLAESYQRQSGNLLLRNLRLGPAKPVFLSRLLTQMGITGVYNPFTGEPNFNTEVPAVEQPFSIAHEMAHQRGFAREDEANLVAFLVCIYSSDAYVRYSGYLMARTAIRRLAAASPDEYRALFLTLAPGPRTDLRAVRQFWAQHLGRTSVASDFVNDKYLRANRVANGTDNYLDSDELIIAYYLKVGF
jgi:hypothetical protein